MAFFHSVTALVSAIGKNVNAVTGLLSVIDERGDLLRIILLQVLY